MKFESPRDAYYWAFSQGKTDESREAVLSSPEYSYRYALNLDEHPRDDTRQAVLSSPEYSYRYARFVDGQPRDDTRKAVLSSPRYTYEYVEGVDKGMIHPDVAKVMKPLFLMGNKWAVRLFKEFGDKK